MSKRSTPDMELTAHEFICHPEGIPAHTRLSPLIAQIGTLDYSGTIGEKNSNQIDSDFDNQLAEWFRKMPGVRDAAFDMPGVTKEFDFGFRYGNSSVVVEVEKANWEKVLYDFLKAHMYLAHGADFVLVFVPRHYVHAGKSPTRSFEKARRRYDQCLQYGFGSPEKFGRILLVSYDVRLRDGSVYSPAVRKQLIESARSARLNPRSQLD